MPDAIRLLLQLAYGNADEAQTLFASLRKTAG